MATNCDACECQQDQFEAPSCKRPRDCFVEVGLRKQELDQCEKVECKQADGVAPDYIANASLIEINQKADRKSDPCKDRDMACHLGRANVGDRRVGKDECSEKRERSC